MADFRYAFRALLANPGFAITAVFTLALGIGANTAIFTVIDGVLLKPLPYGAPDRLVRISETRRGGAWNVAYPNYLRLARAQPQLRGDGGVQHLWRRRPAGRGHGR